MPGTQEDINNVNYCYYCTQNAFFSLIYFYLNSCHFLITEHSHQFIEALSCPYNSEIIFLLWTVPVHSSQPYLWYIPFSNLHLFVFTHYLCHQIINFYLKWGLFIQLIATEGLLCARHCAKHKINIIVLFLCLPASSTIRNSWHLTDISVING